ncbi:hypothetical protein L3H42_10630, partial [Corynebacterium sp. MC-13]|nr:hypothetical protein [Corynebacterium parakroppenstedtii]
ASWSNFLGIFQIFPSTQTEQNLGHFNTFGFNYVYTEHWALKQVVGPYNLPAGKQGRLVWGFLILDTTNQNVTCGEDLTWHEVGAPFDASIPESRYSELRVDSTIEE